MTVDRDQTHLTMHEAIALQELYRVLYLGRRLTMHEYRERRIRMARALMGWSA